MQYHMFYMHWCEQPGGSEPTHQTVHTDSCKIYHTAYIQPVFLRMNPQGLKHVGDHVSNYSILYFVSTLYLFVHYILYVSYDYPVILNILGHFFSLLMCMLVKA
jgi:hypothetical protein